MRVKESLDLLQACKLSVYQIYHHAKQDLTVSGARQKFLAGLRHHLKLKGFVDELWAEKSAKYWTMQVIVAALLEQFILPGKVQDQDAKVLGSAIQQSLK